MKLWIVVNEYLRTPKFSELEKSIEKACDYYGIEHQIVTNADCLVCCESNRITTGIIPYGNDPVLFWDKDIKLGKALEKTGHRLYNSSESISVCDDKTLTALKLASNNIRMPKTLIAPMTYSNIGYNNADFTDYVTENLGFPMIVKEAFGSFGAQVYMCGDYDELMDIVNKSASKTLLFQEYISTSHGRDIRLQVVGDKVTTAMYRYSENGDFRANITNGGSMKPYKANEAEKKYAVAAAELIGLDFCGVDMLFGDNDEPVVCEVNSNAHFINIDNCTGSDTAKDIIAYIISNHTGW